MPYTARPHANLSARLAGLMALTTTLAACNTTDMNAVANRLREENLKQKQEIASLQDAVRNRDATIGDLQQHFAMNQPPLQTLPPDRLAELFTASRLEIRSQTGWDDLGEGKHGFRVFLRTYSSDGEIVPASGTLTIEAFELPSNARSDAEPKRLGVWTFTPLMMKQNWYTELGLNQFAFSCPCDKLPDSPSIVLRVRLRDALTGQTLEAQVDKKITLPQPPTSSPATAASSAPAAAASVPGR